VSTDERPRLNRPVDSVLVAKGFEGIHVALFGEVSPMANPRLRLPQRAINRRSTNRTRRGIVLTMSRASCPGD
jgi:hypothetical protein